MTLTYISIKSLHLSQFSPWGGVVYRMSIVPAPQKTLQIFQGSCHGSLWFLFFRWKMNIYFYHCSYYSPLASLAPFLWTLPSLSMFLLKRGTWIWTQHFGWTTVSLCLAVITRLLAQPTGLLTFHPVMSNYKIKYTWAPVKTDLLHPLLIRHGFSFVNVIYAKLHIISFTPISQPTEIVSSPDSAIWHNGYFGVFHISDTHTF